eukprot:COSAG03_NODE_3280_length_2105_cov_3.293619_3_plen_516_part_00
MMGGDDQEEEQDVAVPDFVGLAVQQKFVGYGEFRGTVTAQNPNGTFSVKYEDGDTRTLSRDKLKKWLVKPGPPEPLLLPVKTKREAPAPTLADEPPTKQSRDETGWGGRPPKPADTVECYFPPPAGQGWECGKVTRVSTLGAVFWVSFEGDSEEYKVNVAKDEWRRPASSADAATPTYDTRSASAVGGVLPALPVVKSEDHIGEHVLMLVKDAEVASEYKEYRMKNKKAVVLPAMLAKRVRGVVAAYSREEGYTIEFPEDPAITPQKLGSLKGLLWRDMIDPARQVAKSGRYLFSKWRSIQMNGSRRHGRLYNIYNVLGGNYMDCTPGIWSMDLEGDRSGTLRTYPGVEGFLAVTTKVHCMAPSCAGENGSIFFDAHLARCLAVFKTRGMPLNLFVGRGEMNRWEYCGRYQITNEVMFAELCAHENELIEEGKDGHGDVWSGAMTEEAKSNFVQGAHSSKLTVSCSHSFSQSNSVPYVLFKVAWNRITGGELHTGWKGTQITRSLLARVRRGGRQ